MKTIPLTAAMAAFGLTALPSYADNATAPEPVIEAVAAKTVGVYILQISGKG